MGYEVLERVSANYGGPAAVSRELGYGSPQELYAGLVNDASRIGIRPNTQQFQEFVSRRILEEMTAISRMEGRE